MAVALVRTDWRRELRTLLVLGRVSNLPTVWSNCLAGWVLGSGGSGRRFALLCLGASCLYLGGMFLNDAFDYDFDRQHRKERPLPSGAISLGKVWGWGLGWLVAGVLLLSLLGDAALTLALVLAITIVAYDAIHKAVTLSPVLMAACRFLLYLLAASAASDFTGLAIWSGFAAALYVLGLSYIARRESTRRRVAYWPCWLLGAPVLLAWIVNGPEYKTRAILLSLVLVIWVVRCLAHSFWGPNVSVGLTVSGLLAGLCLVDLLAVTGSPALIVTTFFALFAAALLSQKLIPAT
jgi:4-hydroxybenzoate polyprenyltransferase